MRGTISKCADSDTEELLSLQCHMEDRSPESLFLEERTDGGDGVNRWQVRDHQSLCAAVQKTPHITAYCNSPAHESSSGGLAFDPRTVGHDGKVVPFPVSPCIMEMTCV